MWIFNNDSMVSIVQERGKPHWLRVRARLRGDIEQFMEPVAHLMKRNGILIVDVFEPEGSDYRYHAVLPAALVGQCVYNRIMDIEYDDFKGSIPYGEETRIRRDAYSATWSAMRAAQGTERMQQRDE